MKAERPLSRKKAAEKYFSTVNSDERCDYKYHPLKEMKKKKKKKEEEEKKKHPVQRNHSIPNHQA